MTAENVPQTNSLTARSSLALGLCLGRRWVGLALVSREHLVRALVLNLATTGSQRGRLRRFAAAVGTYLDAYGASRIAVVHRGELTDTPLTPERAWLAETASLRGVPLADYAADTIRQAHVPAGTRRATTQTLAEALAERFPELASRTPAAEGVPGADKVPELARIGRRVISPRARYWSWMFLALGSALHDLDEDVKSRLFT